MLVIRVVASARKRVDLFGLVCMQVMHDDVHRHRRAEERQDEEGEHTNGRATHSECRVKRDVGSNIPCMSAQNDEPHDQPRCRAVVSGIGILGGLLTSTALNMFVMPAVYSRIGSRK